MATNRREVESYLKEAEANFAKAQAKTKHNPAKKCPEWRKAKAVVKQAKRRLAAIEKLETREAKLKAAKSA